MTAETAAHGASQSRARVISFLAIPTVAALFAFRALWDFDPDAGVRRAVSGIEGWFFSPTGRSPVFIFSVGVLLFWGRLSRFLGAIRNNQPSPLVAAALLLPASGLYFWSYYVGAPDILVMSLIVTIIGAGFATAGAAGGRAILLPALFLILSIPPPAVWINQIIYPLQLTTAHTSVWVLNHLRWNAVQSGDLISIPDRVFQVIETCSGLRSMETITMSAVLYGELFYWRPAQVVILFLCAPLISVIANQVRVLSIILNPLSAVATVHTIQGILVLVGGVLTLALLDRGLHAILPELKHRPLRVPLARTAPLPERSLVVLTGLMLSLGFASVIMPKWLPPPRIGRTLSDFPLVLRGWKSRPEEVDTRFLGSTKFTERQSRVYFDQASGGEFDLFVGIDEHYQRNFSLISTKTALPGTGWVVKEWRPAVLSADSFSARRLIVERGGQRRLVYRWYENVDGLAQEILRSAFALDRSFLRRPDRSTVVRISAPVAASGMDEAEVDARLQTFAPLIHEAVAALGDGTWSAALRRKLAAPSAR